MIAKFAKLLMIPALCLVVMAPKCNTTAPSGGGTSSAAAKKGDKEEAKLRAEIRKAEKDLKDARQQRIDSHYGFMEATGNRTGPSLAGPMVEPPPSPYGAQQVEMHRKNYDIAAKEEGRLKDKLSNLRGQLEMTRRSAKPGGAESVARETARHAVPSVPKTPVRSSAPVAHHHH